MAQHKYRTTHTPSHERVFYLKIKFIQIIWFTFTVLQHLVHRKHHRKRASKPYILDAVFITIAERGSGLQLEIVMHCRISASWLCAAFGVITFFEQKSCRAIGKFVGEVSFDRCRQRPTNWAASNDHNCDPPQLPDRGGKRLMYSRLEISTFSVFQLLSTFLIDSLTFFDSYRGL